MLVFPSLYLLWTQRTSVVAIAAFLSFHACTEHICENEAMASSILQRVFAFRVVMFLYMSR